MSHVFISYSRKDTETVDDIAARLEADKFEVWVDREEIHGGDLWREEIVDAIDNAYAFVLMLSPRAAASDNVRKEVDLAEGAAKKLVPVLLARTKLSSRLRYQLAGVQYIDYYRDPKGKYPELVKVLRSHRPKPSARKKPATREVEIVIRGLNPSQFGPEKQELLLNFIAELTKISRTDVNLTTVRAGSVHLFISMPPSAAYKLKTAALNQDTRLAQAGIDALRLTGDRHFVVLKQGGAAPPKSGSSSGGLSWWIGGLALVIALLLTAMIGYVMLPSIIPQVFATATPTATNTFTPTFTDTPTASPTSSFTPSPTETFTPTPTATSTPTPTDTPTLTSPPPPLAPRPVSPAADQVYNVLLTKCANVTFAWRPGSTEDVSYTLLVQTATGSRVVYAPNLRNTYTSATLCPGSYQWQVRATRISDGLTGPWSESIPFKVKLAVLKIPPIKPNPNSIPNPS